MTYTLAQASRTFGIPHSTLRQWIWLGKLKAVKVGRDWLIDEKALKKHTGVK